jgi:hypothetical protein
MKARHTWTAPTPTSLANQKLAQEQAQKLAQEQAQKQAEYRNQQKSRAVRERELDQHEREQIREQSRAGLLRSPEEERRRRSGLDRRMLQKGVSWLPPEEEHERERAHRYSQP